MKKILLIALIVLSNYFLRAQSECLTAPVDHVAGTTNYLYNLNGPVKVIRVNFHFLLKSDGTGNFTETSDNYSNRPYNGYMYAEYMVNECNKLWNDNPPLRHMPNPPVSNLPKKVQFQLCGVFFHRNTTAYDTYVNCTFPPDSYLENSGNVINIFITKHGDGGCASGLANGEVTNISTGYGNYKQSIDSNEMWYNSYAYRLINHEIGHLLNLDHVVQDCCTQLNDGKIPTVNCHDGIADTPDFYELLRLHYLPCEWNHPTLGSNNVMDYCADQNSLSPMQIERMHACIDGTKLYYRNCKYNTNSLNITSFTTNKAYIARYVTIPSNNNVVVGNTKALFINAEEVIINGTLEIQSGGILNVETVTSCN